MIKFQIKKKTNNIWQHFIIDGKTFILSDCYCKTNGDFFRVVEMGGSQRNEFHFSEIEVYNIGGLAETFTSSLALMQRLKSLNYVGFIREGDVVTADLISTDASNSVIIGTDGGLFVPNFNAQSNTIINDAGFALVGNSLTINAGWVWNINGLEYTNNFNALLNIPFASVGYNRIDLIVANKNNSFSRIEGVEDISNPTAPTQPIDTILISFINVSDGDISDPTIPIVGDVFVRKSDFQTVENTQLGADVIVNLPLNGASYINFTNPLLESISGVSFLAPVDEANEPPYPGKPFIFKNLTGNPITIKNNQTVLFFERAFLTKDGLDIVIPTGEHIRFNYGAKLEDSFRSWGSGGGGGGSDIIEVANLAALPATGEAAKIYITIDTNLQYRWSGSAYVQIGGGSEVEQQLQRYWYSMTVNTLNTNLMLVNNTNSFTISGTASVIPRGGISYYNSFAMNNYLSATANGSNCGIKNNNQGDGSYLEGFDSSFVFINNDINVNCETTVGYYGLLSAIPNIAKSAYTADFTGVGNDVGDTNLSFYCKRSTETPSYTKVDCGANFPAHTTTDAYILRMQMTRGFNGSGRTLKMTITNIITGAVFSHTFTDSQIPPHSRNICMVVNRSNRNTGVETNIRFSKWHQTKFIY